MGKQDGIGGAWVRLPRLLHFGAMLAGCAMTTSSCSSAVAEDRWQCHAAAGQFDTHDIDVPENTTGLVGEMIIHKAGEASQWQPYVKAALVNKGWADQDCHCNGIAATWFANDPAFFTVALSADGKDQNFGRVPYDKPVTFKLDYARSGALKLKVGTGEATGMSPDPRRNTLHLSCSSADVDFRITEVRADESKSPERCPFAAQEQWSTADIDRYCKVGK